MKAIVALNLLRLHLVFASIVLSSLQYNPSYSQDSTTQVSYIPLPPAIATEGIPRIPADLVNDIKPYTESRVAYLQDWHPVRKEMLILTRFGNAMQSHIVKMPGGIRKQVTFYEEPTYSSLFDPQKGEYIIVSKDVGGNEFNQIYRQDLATGKTVLLTDGGHSENFNIRWNRKGDRLLYTSFQKDRHQSNVYMVDPKNPKSNQLLVALDGMVTGIEISNDDSKILLNGETLWLYDTRLKTKSPVWKNKGRNASFYARGFSADGAGFYLVTDEGNEFGQLAYYDLRTKKLTILTHFDWDVYRAFPSPDGKHVAFTVNEAGVFKAYVLNTATKKYKPINGLPVGLISGLTWTNDSELLGFQLSTSNANSDIYTWNSKTGAVIPWVQNELGGIDASTIPAPELIKWKSFDGLELSGFLYPVNKKFKGKRPVIIDIHGGPVAQALPLFNGTGNYYTNELGIVVIHPNIRGSSGYGKNFTELDNGLKKEDAVKDIGALLDWIAGQPDLDASRVMVTGGSYGGYMTYRSSIAYNTRIRCALAAFGGTNLITDINSVDSAYRVPRRAEFGDERDSAVNAYFTKTAPVNNADKLTMPIFIVHGKNDPRVNYTESKQMVEAIRQAGGKVWYMLANDEGHGFLQKPSEDYLFYATVEFIKTFLTK